MAIPENRNAVAALEFFAAMLEESDEPLWQKYLGTHPITEDRIRTMQELLDRLENRETR